MSNEINRRQLLKILAATAGTAMLSSIPNKWKTPVVDVGMLPAHAQSLSGTGTITGNVVIAGNPISRSPLPNGCTFATVVVLNTNPLLTACADRNGDYIITNVPAGLYSVRADSYGCTQTLNNIQVIAGQITSHVDFDNLNC